MEVSVRQYCQNGAQGPTLTWQQLCHQPRTLQTLAAILLREEYGWTDCLCTAARRQPTYKYCTKQSLAVLLTLVLLAGTAPLAMSYGPCVGGPPAPNGAKCSRPPTKNAPPNTYDQSCLYDAALDCSQHNTGSNLWGTQKADHCDGCFLYWSHCLSASGGGNFVSVKTGAGHTLVRHRGPSRQLLWQQDCIAGARSWCWPSRGLLCSVGLLGAPWAASGTCSALLHWPVPTPAPSSLRLIHAHALLSTLPGAPFKALPGC